MNAFSLTTRSLHDIDCRKSCCFQSPLCIRNILINSNICIKISFLCLTCVSTTGIAFRPQACTSAYGLSRGSSTKTNRIWHFVRLITQTNLGNSCRKPNNKTSGLSREIAIFVRVFLPHHVFDRKLKSAFSDNWHVAGILSPHAAGWVKSVDNVRNIRFM